MTIMINALVKLRMEARIIFVPLCRCFATVDSRNGGPVINGNHRLFYVCMRPIEYDMCGGDEHGGTPTCAKA